MAIITMSGSFAIDPATLPITPYSDENLITPNFYYLNNLVIRTPGVSSAPRPYLQTSISGTASQLATQGAYTANPAFINQTLEVNYFGSNLTYNAVPGDTSTISTVAGGQITSLKISSEWNVIANPRQPVVIGRADQSFEITVTNFSIDVTQLNTSDPTTIISIINKGDDQIFGSQLDEWIDAGTGNDTVNADAGNDLLFGEAGNDTLFGAQGRDSIYGGAGNDTIFGGSDNDYIYGDDGNDLLFGDDGTDQMGGGDGNDWLVGGAGVDFLFGGNGDDGVVFDRNDVNNGIMGGEGFDTLFVDQATDGNPFDFDLVKNGFEQAIINRVDTNNQSWATNALIYDTAWQLVKSDYTNDDGSRTVYRFDPAGSQAWNEIRSFYTADGRLDYEQTYFDNGSSSLLDFDLSNTVIWNSRTLTVSASGAVVSDVFVLDAQIGQRSAEIGATVIAVKAVPVESLI